MPVVMSCGTMLFMHADVSTWTAWVLCRLTEADVRLYPTAIRYDAVYATLFKCSRRRIADYPHLQAWLRDMFQITVEPSSSLQVCPSPGMAMLTRAHATSRDVDMP